MEKFMKDFSRFLLEDKEIFDEGGIGSL